MSPRRCRVQSLVGIPALQTEVLSCLPPLPHTGHDRFPLRSKLPPVFPATVDSARQIARGKIKYHKNTQARGHTRQSQFYFYAPKCSSHHDIYTNSSSLQYTTHTLINTLGKDRGKRKGQPRTGHEGTDGE